MLPGATVVVRSPATGLTRETTSDAPGVFRAPLLPVGGYEITVSLSGFATTLFLLVAFSAMAVPGLNGFIGELLILIGSFKASLFYGLTATIGLVLGAVYLLWMYKRVMYGAITKEENKNLKDMTGREYAYLLPIILFIVWIGAYPKPFLDKMDASVGHLLEIVNNQGPAVADAGKNIMLTGGDAGQNPEHFAPDQRR